ncbi:MAG: hypoxanthine phosphoribosyltransferase [Planctomycetaceae bacterium]|nr:hypoxanthine phosphoribosyltransferase [Planctomycetaceae bacterium]
MNTMAKKRIEILFENDEILVVNKPVGISVTADRGGADDLLMLLTRQLSPAEPLRLVHRLDKETSGILLIARSRTAQSRYSRLFAKRMIQKLYLAIVRGPLPYRGGSIKDPIARSKRNPQAMHVHPRLGKPSHTVWKELADFGTLSLVAAQIVTGRTHQIRVHFAHRGMPLAIDPIYASAEPLMLSAYKSGYRPKIDKEEPPLIDRLTLHAYQLTIPVGPQEDAEMRTFTAPPDKKFVAAVKLLAKYKDKSAPGFHDQNDLLRILRSEQMEYPLKTETGQRLSRREKEAAYNRILVSEEQLEQTVRDLARRLNDSYPVNEPATAVVLLEGARRFAEDLLKHLVFTVEVRYLKASSYYGSTESSELVCIEDSEKTGGQIAGRNVLVIDDIYDTGRTLAHVLDWIRTRQPKSVKTCVLLEKRVRHEKQITIDFGGLEVDNAFVIGYGLDYDGKFRDLPFVAALPDDFEN